MTTPTLPTTVSELQELVCKVQSENEQIRTKVDRLESLESENERLRAEMDRFQSLESEVEGLRERLRLLLHKTYGSGSEKSASQLQLFDEVESILEEFEGEELPEPDRAEPKKVSPKKRGRKPLPSWLERFEVVHDIPADEKICCGQDLKRIGEETNEQLEFIPATIRVIRNVRPKYACSVCEDGVHIAKLPPQAIPKSMATSSLLAQIAVSKYADSLPLYRQENILQRAGIEIPRTTMANWMIKVGQIVQPIVNLMRDELLAGNIIQCDETHCQVLKESGRDAKRKSYIWAQRGGERDRPVILFDYDPTRGSEVPKALLADFEGYVQVDGYSGYDGLFRTRSTVNRVGCWAHARRKFDEALKAQGGKGKKPGASGGKAAQGLTFIRELYKVEKDLRETSPTRRKSERLERSRPVLQRMQVWLKATLPQVPPKSLTGKALGYLSDQWQHLQVFLEDGGLEIDNNGIENAIRPFVVGRKNWLFSDTVRGAEASVNIYSLIETAKRNGLDPLQYLNHLLEELPKAETIEEIERLTPFAWSPAPLPDGVTN